MGENEIVERVGPDPILNGDEKETTITMYGQDKEFDIFSAKPSLIKSLLKHDNFTLERARVVNDEETHRVNEREELETTKGEIVAVEGSMPVGVLTVKSKPRVNNHQSSIINTETIDSSVFE